VNRGIFEMFSTSSGFSKETEAEPSFSQLVHDNNNNNNNAFHFYRTLPSKNLRVPHI